MDFARSPSLPGGPPDPVLPSSNHTPRRGSGLIAGVKAALVSVVLLATPGHDNLIKRPVASSDPEPEPVPALAVKEPPPPEVAPMPREVEIDPCSQKHETLWPTKNEFIAAIPELVRIYSVKDEPRAFPPELVTLLEAEAKNPSPTFNCWKDLPGSPGWSIGTDPRGKTDPAFRWHLTCVGVSGCKDGKTVLREPDYILRNAADPAACVLLEEGRVLYKDAKFLRTIELADAIKTTLELRKKEKGDPGGLRNFDLPKKKKIGLIMLVDTEDAVLQRSKPQIEAWPEILGKRYQIVRPKEPILTGRSPDGSGVSTRLERQVAELKAQGIEDIIIRIFAHGDKTGFQFGLSSLSAANLMYTVLHEHNNTNFLLEPISCNAGGLQRMMRGFRDHAKAKPGRVTALLQTKPDNPGYLTTVTHNGKRYAITAYDLKMAELLLSDKPEHADMTYGSMHLEADQFAKNTVFTDAEGWQLQPDLPSTSTTMAEPKPQTPPVIRVQLQDLLARKDEDVEVVA